MRSFGIAFGGNSFGPSDNNPAFDMFGTLFEGTAFVEGAAFDVVDFFGIASGTNFFEGTAFVEGAAFDVVNIFASRPRDGAAAGGGCEGGDEPWAGPCTSWP